MKQEIIGIERVMLNREKGLKWNNKKIKWSIVHNCNNQSKIYDVELQMVLVSSKRILKVNEQIKNIQMCSFGYQVQFSISDTIKGYIKQDGLSFELYLNGNSFTKLQSQNHLYQPPKLSGSTVDSLQCNNHPRNSKQVQNNIFKCLIQNREENKKFTSNQAINQFKQANRNSLDNCKMQKNNKQMKYIQNQDRNIKQINLKPKSMSFHEKVLKKSTQNSLKDTHSQLMKILIQQKKRKRLQKQIQQSNLIKQFQ